MPSAASAPAPPPAPEPAEPAVPTATPETAFAARTPPPEPPRPRPARRQVVFFDVENTSRPEHVARVLDHLELDWVGRDTELVAVGNWRVVSHETARLLAQRGAQLVHSAPAAGVRDWSDLRIAVAAGAWLAAARSGDQIAIVTDDQAFDAVGDVAASLGVGFRRLSYRALAGIGGEVAAEESPAAPRSRRRGRGRRRGHAERREQEPAAVAPAAAEAEAAAAGAHTAPHDEILAVVRELLATSSSGGVSLDALSNALKARGFRRPPGSPRLITRLHRIKEIEVLPGNLVRLANAEGEGAPAAPAVPAPSDEPAATPVQNGGQRRRRRRGGRRRRGRGAGAAAPTPASAGDA